MVRDGWLRLTPGVLEHALQIIETLPALGLKGYFVTDMSNLFKRLETFGRTSVSLYNGFRRHDQDFVDFSSANLVARTATELAVVLEYIFAAPNTPEPELKFRHAVWRLKGYLERLAWLEGQSLKDPKKSLKEQHPDELPKAQQAVTKWTAKLEKNEFFKLRSPNQQERARAGILHQAYGEPSFMALAKCLSLRKAYYRHLYSYNSNHIHSTSISAFQAAEARTLEDQLDLCSPPFIQTFAMLARGIRCMKGRARALGTKIPVPLQVERTINDLLNISEGTQSARSSEIFKRHGFTAG
jgi:hypothetical protein